MAIKCVGRSGLQSRRSCPIRSDPVRSPSIGRPNPSSSLLRLSSKA
jgi:hypothetical protein